MPAQPTKKKLVRRTSPDRSQRIRRVFQLAFLLLNLAIGVQFYLFVRHFETGGRWPAIARPSGVEGWLPIASLMNLKVFVLTGALPALHAAGLFLLVAFLATAFLFRKSFCSWLCPIGTVSEWLWKLGQRTFRRNRALPRWADIPLRGLKYLLLGLFLYAVASMSVAGIRAFLGGPYGVIADVKMLNFFRHLGVGGAIVVAALVGLSIVVKNFWCRYLCPYGALFGLVARISPVRIRRDASPCIDCGKCTKACPSLIPVDQLVTIGTPECTGCYECIAVCPAEGALEMRAAGRRVPAWVLAAGTAAIFLGVVAYAHWTGHWDTHIPDSVYSDLIPRASEFGHP